MSNHLRRPYGKRNSSPTPKPTRSLLSVQSLEDRLAPAIFGVTNANDAGAGSLRQAITDANAAAGAGSLWVANQYSGTVSRIDPRRDRVAASMAVGGTPTSLAAGQGRLWVGVAAGGPAHQGGTLTIVTAASFGFNLATDGPAPRPSGLLMVSGGGFDTRYREWGTSGTPVVLVPGAFETADTFGALAYHYGNRRLVFLKSRTLVELVASLHDYPSAAEAVDALVPEPQRAAYRRALARLADAQVIDAR